MARPPVSPLGLAGGSSRGQWQSGATERNVGVVPAASSWSPAVEGVWMSVVLKTIPKRKSDLRV